nr:hypothetical protein PAB0683 - Pyrococcus abyssi (strain Orsay) [Pyrococcus abyssi]
MNWSLWILLGLRCRSADDALYCILNLGSWGHSIEFYPSCLNCAHGVRSNLGGNYCVYALIYEHLHSHWTGSTCRCRGWILNYPNVFNLSIFNIHYSKRWSSCEYRSNGVFQSSTISWNRDPHTHHLRILCICTDI